MSYSYVEIEYVATSFSPARTDLALKLLMGPRGAPTTCNQHGASRSYSFGQIWADRKQIFVLIPMWFLRVLAFWAVRHRARVIYLT